MPFPSGEPAWQITDLQQLAASNQLFGINPLVLSGVAANESGWEVKGAGVNPEGYGGFFGLGQNSKYSFGGSTFQDTTAELEDPSSASFELQAQTAAAEIAHLLQGSGGNLQGALASYTGGGPSNGDYELAIQYLAGASPAGPNSTIGSNQVGESGSGAGSTNTNLASTAASTTPTPAQLSGAAGILQDIDAFLNPHQSSSSSIPIIGSILSAPSDIESTILLVVGRGLFTIFFLGVVLGGTYLLVRKPANLALGAALPVSRNIQASRRLSQSASHLEVSRAAENRRYAAAGLQSPLQ